MPEILIAGKPVQVHDSIRTRHDYRGDNLYVITTFEDAGFFESILLNQTSDLHEHAETVSGLEFVAGLINELTACGKLGTVVELAKSTSLGSRTLPGIIAQVLGEYGGQND